ncbi:MAG: glycoside hydrolase family 2 protein [Candidatus Helarchaeota archaeon]
MSKYISLNGNWKFIIDKNDKGINLGYWKKDYNDESWKSMPIPSNWYLNGLDYSGAVWFRHKFDLNFSQDDIISLIFKGVDYYTKVWLNNHYLGDHEGYFGSFKFKISDLVENKNNILVVKVCAPFDPGFPMKKKLFKGGLVHWDLRPGTVSLKGQEKGSGGIWQPVYIKISKKVEINNIIITPEIKEKDIIALIDFQLFNFYNTNLRVKINLTATPVNFSGKNENYNWTIDLHPRENQLNFIIRFQDPKLWWTWDLGNPNLYKLKLEIWGEKNLINSEEQTFGLRKLEERLDGWYLNNKPIFLRGSSYFSSCWLSEMTTEKFQKDIKLIKEGNMNILRLGYHVEPQIFYNLCDIEGILIWQDFPLLWDYDVSKTRIKEACRQMSELILQFYSHPSISIWCCHCEPISPNQLALDISLKKTIEKIDKSKRKIFLAAEHKDHPFVGWYYSTYYNFLTLPGGKNPNEFGAQSLPNINSKFWHDLGKNSWPINKKWKYHDFQKFITLYLAEVLKDHKGKITLKEFIKYSQEYQARLLKFGIEAYRRGKEKIHGIILFTFNDAWPSITWSIVDYYRNPKLAYYSVKKSYQPVLCSVEFPSVPIPNIPNIQLIVLNLREIILAPLKAFSWNEFFTHNSTVKFNLWIINDFPYPIKNASLKVDIVHNDNIIHFKRYKLDIPKSCCIFIKKFRFRFDNSLEFGEYIIKTEIKDSQSQIISENDFTIYLSSYWNKIKNYFIRFFKVFKNYFASILGQETQIQMFYNSMLGKYKKLAKKTWCIDTI